MNVSYIYIYFLNLEFVKFTKGLLVIIERKRKIYPLWMWFYHNPIGGFSEMVV